MSAAGKLKILVVEDEQSIRQGLCDVLAFRGYEVEFAVDGQAALDTLGAQRFDLVLLDVMLPEVDGFTVCRRLREGDAQVPVLMLTAKGSEEDILMGFEAGVDDYVTKPFSVRQLLARVQALLKRAGKLNQDTFKAGSFEVQPSRGCAVNAEQEIALSQKEILILRLLCEEPGRILSRRTLLRDVWGMNNVDAVETRTVDMHIAKLRKKLGEDGGRVETVRGHGYRWSA